MDEYSQVTVLKGVGEKAAEKLAKLGIFTLGDLMEYYPRSYEGALRIEPLENCADYEGTTDLMTVRLRILTSPTLRFVKKFRILSCVAGDDTMSMTLQWFNQPYLKNILKTGSVFIFRGYVKRRGSSYYLSNPRILSEEVYEQMSSSLIPVYPLTKGVTSSQLTKLLHQAFDSVRDVADCLKEDMSEGGFLYQKGLMGRYEALKGIHFAADRNELCRARSRLAFDEFLVFMLRVRSMKSEERCWNTLVCERDPRLDEMIKQLPYELTSAQKRAMEDIASDLSGPYMMNRLIQGDVGCGKTIVAFYALLSAALSGYQCALMAPTEVLAKQHYEQLCALVKESFPELSVVYLAGSMTEKEKREARERIAEGSVAIAVGTHALIQDGVSFKKPGLVVTDEQHRFGVDQRMRLSQAGKEERRVHTLVMSATPIPRTLAMILYGDLDITLIDELPASRLPIKNCVVGPEYRKKACSFIEDQIKEGRQALVICPMALDSESMEGENVIEYAGKLEEELSPSVRIEYLHGKMKGKEKNEIMNRFAAGETDVLVSTTVVEVGINVPNTTVMLVENAERFGLAQLHQLRGRVGRGKHQSYCIFMCTSRSEEAKKRLDILNRSNDGFAIAEEDLKQRGPGDMFGVRQSGDMAFRIADIYSDAAMLSLASEYAGYLCDTGRVNDVLQRQLDRSNRDMVL